jgi:hypothetical protein
MKSIASVGHVNHLGKLRGRLNSYRVQVLVQLSPLQPPPLWRTGRITCPRKSEKWLRLYRYIMESCFESHLLGTLKKSAQFVLDLQPRLVLQLTSIYERHYLHHQMRRCKKCIPDRPSIRQESRSVLKHGASSVGALLKVSKVGPDSTAEQRSLP